MNITFFVDFKKRINSTKIPDGSDPDASYLPDVVTGTLKEPCSILNPVISIQTPPSFPDRNEAPTAWAYAYIPAFHRYYFVDDWTWNTGLWTVSMTCDVLASYKESIGEISAYIERCAFTSNGKIIDKLYPAKDDYSIVETRLTNCPWTSWHIENGTYIIGIISKTAATNAGGAVQYYALTQTQINNLLTYMLNDQFYNDAGFQNNMQVSRDLAKCLVNPIQYITSCMWFPAPVSYFTEANDVNIQVGPWATIGVGKPISGGGVTYTEWFNVTLPVHPESLDRGDFLNYSPYTTYLCAIPPFGYFMLDPSYMNAERQIRFTAIVDGITGKAILEVRRNDPIAGESGIFCQRTAMFGVPIQLAQITTDYVKGTSALVNVATSALSTVGSALVGNIPGAITGGLMTISSIGNALEAAMPTAVSDGVDGSFIAFNVLSGAFASITSKFTKLVNEDNTEMGRPLCEVRVIDTLPGFIKCGDAHVDFAGAFTEEKNRIQNFMLSGFFWE